MINGKMENKIVSTMMEIGPNIAVNILKSGELIQAVQNKWSAGSLASSAHALNCIGLNFYTGHRYRLCLAAQSI